MSTRSLAFVAAVVFFLVSPGFACGPAEPEFQYGATEMRAAVVGDWVVTITPTSGAAATYHVRLAQAAMEPSAYSALVAPRGLVRAAHACGSRTLVASASACVEISSMPLTVTLAPGDPLVSPTPSGKFWVAGTEFTMGYLELVLGDYRVNAQLAPDGSLQAPPVIVPLGGPTGTVTLARL